MTSRQEAIDVVSRALCAPPANLALLVDEVRIAAVLDLAAEFHQIHYADLCPGNRGQRTAVRNARRAKRAADENVIAVVAQRDALAAEVAEMKATLRILHEVTAQLGADLHALADEMEDSLQSDYADRLRILAGPAPDDDLDAEMRRAGFHGFEGCPEVECETPYQCSERGDCAHRPATSGPGAAVTQPRARPGPIGGPDDDSEPEPA